MRVRLELSFAASLALALTAADARAEPAGGVRAMRLADALAYAKAHQPDVIAAEARVAAARADAKVPRAAWLPVIGAAAEVIVGTANNTTATPVAPGVIDVARIGGTKVVTPGEASWKPSASTYLGVGVDQEVFDFGRIAAESAARDADVLVAQYQGAITALDVAFAVQSAYYAVNAAKAVVVASEGAYARALSHRDLARAGVASGLRPPIELTRAEADLKRFDVGRVRARGGLAAARAQLAAAVGVPELELDAAETASADTAPLPSTARLLHDVNESDPALLAARARVKAQEAETSAIRAQMRPNLWLTGAFSGRGGSADTSSGALPANSWAPLVPNWDVGMVLSWRAFDDTILTRAAASRAREAARRAELAGVARTAESQVAEAYTAAAVADEALPALRRSREAAAANYEQVDARFKAGLSNAVELADAEAIRTVAEIQEALGQFEVSRARAALQRAVGRAPGNAGH